MFTLRLVYPRLTATAHMRCGVALRTLCGRSLGQSQALGCLAITDGAPVCPTCMEQARNQGYYCPSCGIVTVGFVRGVRCLRCAAGKEES